MHLRILLFFLMYGKGWTLDRIFNWLNGNLDEQEVENPQKQTESTNANGTGRLESPVAWHVSLTSRHCPLGLAWHRAFAFPFGTLLTALPSRNPEPCHHVTAGEIQKHPSVLKRSSSEMKMKMAKDPSFYLRPNSPSDCKLNWAAVRKTVEG